jgi:hypothetical protein
VTQKKLVLIAVAALSIITLAGFVTVSLTAQEPVAKSHYPNDRANHHPRHVDG